MPLSFFACACLHFHFLAHVVFVLAKHFERLAYSGASHLEFVVFGVAVKVCFDVLAQLHAVVYPHAVLMVYFDYNAVVGADCQVGKEVIPLPSSHPFTMVSTFDFSII